MSVTARRLESGWWHVRGTGPCEWAQPPHWPCDEATLRANAFPEASEMFIRATVNAARALNPALFEEEVPNG